MRSVLARPLQLRGQFRFLLGDQVRGVTRRELAAVAGPTECHARGPELDLSWGARAALRFASR